MNLYFAYGSNMDASQMKERCPNARLLGPAKLEDHELAFTIYSPKRDCGCADIAAKVGSEVYGLLYEITDTELAVLDEFEGSPIHYRRISVTVKVDDKNVSACAYEVVAKEAGLAPSEKYLQLMRNAANKYNFPEEYRKLLN